MDQDLPRRARFRTVISLVEKGQIVNFEGRIEGKILEQKRGAYGFGYDPGKKTTASGAPFIPSGLTAAHKTLPFGTKLRVTNPNSSTDVLVDGFIIQP